MLADLTARYDDFAEPRPAVELALRWLERRPPGPDRAHGVVHGSSTTAT